MEWVPEALQKNVDLGFAGVSHPVLIAGDELLLAENAEQPDRQCAPLRCPAGGSVTVRLSVSPGWSLPSRTMGGYSEDDGRGCSNAFTASWKCTGRVWAGLAIRREIARAHDAEARR